MKKTKQFSLIILGIIVVVAPLIGKLDYRMGQAIEFLAELAWYFPSELGVTEWMNARIFYLGISLVSGLLGTSYKKTKTIFYILSFLSTTALRFTFV